MNSVCAVSNLDLASCRSTSGAATGAAADAAVCAYPEDEASRASKADSKTARKTAAPMVGLPNAGTHLLSLSFIKLGIIFEAQECDKRPGESSFAPPIPDGRHRFPTSLALVSSSHHARTWPTRVRPTRVR